MGDTTVADSRDAIPLIAEEPLIRVQRALGLIPKNGPGLLRRAVFFALLTWLPIAIWTFWKGRIAAGGLDEPLLQHFGIHVRCLIAIPLLILAEGKANAVFLRLAPHFLDAGLIPDEPAFHAVVQKVARLRDRTLPWVLIAGLVVAWIFLRPEAHQAHDLLWATDATHSGSSGFGGWWYSYVVRPVYVTLVLAWIWRILIFTSFMFRISRLPLSLVPTHADHQGGLGFLAAAPGAFSLVILALSSVLAAGSAHDVMYHDVGLQALRLPAAGFLILMLLGFLAPLLVFTPVLLVTRRQAKLEYSALVARHGRAVREKWIEGKPVAQAEPLLTAPEIGPVADTISLYEAVARMRPLPVGKTSLTAILVPAIIPMIVVVAIRVPIKELLLTIFKALT